MIGRLKAILKNGLFHENPTFRLVLGMCPTLAITYRARNGVGMGLATTFVLVFSNLVISLLRKVIPEKVRIPSFIVIIATFVTIVEMVMHAYFPDLYDTLGVFISLIVVNCIIFARAESFAFQNPPMESAVDGLGMGLGFTLSITLVSCVRELVGAGTVFGTLYSMKALTVLDGVVVFPVRQGGLIVLITIYGILRYKDKFDLRIGAMLASGLLGIVLLNL